MNNTNRFKLEIYDRELNIVAQLDIYETRYTLETKEKSFYEVQCLESLVLDQVYFCQIGLMFGRIISVRKDGELYSYEVALFEDAFDYKISLKSNYSDNIEKLLMEYLESFNNKLFSYIASFNVICESETAGYFIYDETTQLSDLMSQVRRLYNIRLYIYFERENELTIVISKQQDTVFNVGFNDREVIEYEVNFSIENPTMVSVVDEVDNVFNFYLCNNGEIDDDFTINIDRERLAVVKNEIKVVDETLGSIEEARVYAEEILLKSENNEIIIDYDTSQTNELTLLGSYVNFYLPQGVIIKTSITKIECRDDSPIKKITLGATRKNFIDKLKNMKGMITNG